MHMKKLMASAGLVALAFSSNVLSDAVETLSIQQKGVEGTIQEAFTRRDIDAEPVAGEYVAKIKMVNATESDIFKVHHTVSKIKTLAAEAGCKVYSKSTEGKSSSNPSLDELQIECFGDTSK